MIDPCNLNEEQRIALEKAEKKKSQERARSKKYYHSNPRRVLDRQKKSREVKKKEMDQIQTQMRNCAITEPEPEPEPDFTPDYIEAENVVVELPNKNSNYTQEEIIKLLENDANIKSKHTRRTYIIDIKRLFKMTGCVDMKKCLNSYKKMLNSIEKSEYSINSIKQTIQSLLFVSDKYNILHNLFSKKKADDLKKFFKSAFEKFKDKSITELEQKQSTIAYPSFNEYLNKVKNKYGEESKEYLISYLYSLFSVRDDFKNMKILDDIRGANENDNYLLINKNKMMFIINKFKTKNKFKKLQYTVTGKLKTQLNKWIQNKKLKIGGLLFGKSSLSPFVSKINKSLGYNNHGAINMYRHMRVSDLYKGDKQKLTFEDREKLSNEMGHSLLVQKQYERNLEISDVKDA